MFFILINVVALQLVLVSSFEINVLMPQVSPKLKDTYLCRKFKMDEKKPVYITEFQPQSTKEVAHHILLFGCESVMEDEIWNCGEMQVNGMDPIYQNGPVCSDGKQNILYAWAMDAPRLVLPEDVAFKVGGSTKNKYLVLQVHYANVDRFLVGEKDNSGIKLIGQYEALPKIAGVYLLETGGFIKSHSHENFEAACQIQEDVQIHPFAYRTHAHKLGIVNTGYVVKTEQLSKKQNWIELGRRSPQLPQMFFPVTNQIQINPGDILAARCTMVNNQNHDVSIGPTGNDEMCNFYIMYFIKGDTTFNENICVTMGPPFWYFNDFKSLSGQSLDVSKIPKDISSLPANQVKELANINDENGMLMKSMVKSNQDASSKWSNKRTRGQEYNAYSDQLQYEPDLIQLLQMYFKRKNEKK